MATANTPPVSSASFDGSAVFQPAAGQGTVLITGSASDAAAIANIEVFDGGKDIGGTGGFQPGQRGWGFVATLAPGKHILTATVTELSGATYGIASPYELVTGIQNQPYVYQELDENRQGVFTHISDYDGSGALVSQTAVAVSGDAAAPLSIAFDPTATFKGSTEAMLTGTDSAYGSAASVEVFDGAASAVIDPQTGAVRPGASPLGFAALGPDGTWSFDAHVSPGVHAFTAVATGFSGQVAAAQSAFTLDTGVVGNPYVFEEIDHTASGAVAATTFYAADGTVVNRSVQGGATVNGGGSTGELIRSASNDVMTGDGTGNTTFQFRRGFGQDEVTNFNYLSAAQSPARVEHDLLSLPQSVFTTVAQVLRHTTTALDGDAVVHLGRGDSIKLDGVTRADLLTHPNVFRFHA